MKIFINHIQAFALTLSSFFQSLAGEKATTWEEFEVEGSFEQTSIAFKKIITARKFAAHAVAVLSVTAAMWGVTSSLQASTTSSAHSGHAESATILTASGTTAGLFSIGSP